MLQLGKLIASLHSRKNKVLSEKEDALKFYVELRQLKYAVENILDSIQDEAVSEAELYERPTFRAYGAKIEVKNGGGRYSYKHIKEWVEKKKELTDIEKKMKENHKALSSGKLQRIHTENEDELILDTEHLDNLIVDEETGEILNAAIFNPNKQTIAISFKKDKDED